MAGFKVRLDHLSIDRMLKAQFAPEVNRLAEAVGETVREELAATESKTAPGMAAHVQVTPWTTDRARPAVRIAHPAGRHVDAKYGVLAKAAARHGLEVKARKREAP